MRLLQGHRGRALGDLVANREIVLRISGLAEDVREIAELDLNPFKVLTPDQGSVWLMPGLE